MLEPFEYDLEEYKNNLIYRGAPTFVTGQLCKSQFMDLGMVYDFATEITRALRYRVSPLNALYTIKWVLDFSKLSSRRLPECYAETHNWLIRNHTIEQLSQPEPLYEDGDRGYTGIDVNTNAFMTMT